MTLLSFKHITSLILTAELFFFLSLRLYPTTGAHHQQNINSPKMQTITTFLLLLLTLTIPTFSLPTQYGRRDACTPAASSSSPSSPSSSSSSSTTNASTGGVNPALVPDFGVVPGTNANAKQTGSCDGFAAATNAVTLIPCNCPPNRATFLAALNENVAKGSVEGTPVEFSNDATDQSEATNTQRATALLVTLQNLNGPGVGCPAASAPNFAVQQKTGAVSNKAFVE